MSLWSIQLDEALLGSSEASAVHEAIARLGFKYKKGKNKQSFSKNTCSCSYHHYVVGGLCVYTRAHTLNRIRIILRPNS